MFTQSPTKIFYINVFNIVGCLASSLTFKSFLTLNVDTPCDAPEKALLLF